MKPIIKIALVLASLTTSVAAWAAGDCQDSVFVEVDEANMTVLPKDVFVCQNGTVTWTSAGPTRFQVVFPGRRAGETTRDDPLTQAIQATAPVGEYPYDVMIRGQALDPRIIIR